MLFNKLDHFIYLYDSYNDSELNKNINLFLIDDSTNNDIEDYINSKSNTEVINFNYIRNEETLGHDRNYLNIYKMVQENYFWILPDYFDILKFDYLNILSSLKIYNYDFLILNIHGRLGESLHKSNLVDNKELIVNSTLSGSVIYSQKVLSQFNYSLALKSINFPQVSLFIQTIKNNFSYNTLDILISPVIKVKNESYWRNNILKVFFDDLYNVGELNGLNSDESLALVKVHINMAKLSGIKGLAKLILSKNGVNINQLMGYLHYFDFSDKLIIYFIYYLRIYTFRLT
jgi:hypothetical protein